MDINKIIQINDLIQGGRSGKPSEMADKIGVSERMLYYIISFMKEELQAPVKYCRTKQRYYYEYEGVLVFKWQSAICK